MLYSGLRWSETGVRASNVCNLVKSEAAMLAGEIVTGPQRQLQWKEIFLFPTNSFVKLTPFLVCSLGGGQKNK